MDGDGPDPSGESPLHEDAGVRLEDAQAGLLNRDLQVVVAKDFHESARQSRNFLVHVHLVDEHPGVDVRPDILQEFVDEERLVQRKTDQFFPEGFVTLLLAEFDGLA